MRVDAITIFPEYFDALHLSLLGKAQERGVLDLRVHNLRDVTHDRHQTVDGKPAGGGAGMVMQAEPWAQTIDPILAESTDPLIVFPSPAGEVFTQQTARELSQEPHLVFGCGRYEGIDQRVFDEYSARARVKLLSIGDYVLNGGEVASIVMIEAIARLIPGVIGNPESLVEESHESGLLEYPNYTAPASWRGRQIPDVLLSGDHARIAKWRRQQQEERTQQVRPDLWERLLDSGDH